MGDFEISLGSSGEKMGDFDLFLESKEYFRGNRSFPFQLGPVAFSELSL